MEAVSRIDLTYITNIILIREVENCSDTRRKEAWYRYRGVSGKVRSSRHERPFHIIIPGAKT